MKFALAAVIVLTLAGVASASIGGASVNILSPTAVVPGQTYMFRFWVQNASTDGEAIANVQVSFPDGYTLHEPSMYYIPISVSPLRPSWTKSIPPVDHTGQWIDNNGGTGQGPHRVCGCIELSPSSVENTSWSVIKAIYR